MINWLIEFSLRHRGLVIAIYLALAAWGYWALLRTPVDAIPDLSENQVIVFTDWTGRSPQEVEDQVTYPLVTNLQGLPGVRVVRASSAFGFSMIYVIFEDSVDLYWARTRVLERLNLVGKQLPAGVVPTLGPDATGVGQIFWYTLESDRMSLRDLGYEPSDTELAEVYGRVTALADKSKQVRPRDLVAIAHEVLRRRPGALTADASPAA